MTSTLAALGGTITQAAEHASDASTPATAATPRTVIPVARCRAALASGMRGQRGGGMGGHITTWVSGHYPASTVGGVTVYDLTEEAA